MVKKIISTLSLTFIGIGLFVMSSAVFANGNGKATLIDISNWQCDASVSDPSSIVTSSFSHCYNGNIPPQHYGEFFYADGKGINITDLGKISVEVSKTENKKGFTVQMYYNSSIPEMTYTFKTMDALEPGKTYYILFVNSNLAVSTHEPQ